MRLRPVLRPDRNVTQPMRSTGDSTSKRRSHPSCPAVVADGRVGGSTRAADRWEHINRKTAPFMMVSSSTLRMVKALRPGVDFFWLASQLIAWLSRSPHTGVGRNTAPWLS